MDDLYYLQDSRGQYVGNSLLWWRANFKGYTTNISEAHVWSKEDAIRQHIYRETDIPWPKSYIDSHTQVTVDHQTVRIQDALIGIILKPKVYEKHTLRCKGCGRFVSRMGMYSAHTCSYCDNE